MKTKRNKISRIIMLLLVALVCSAAPVQTQAGMGSALTKSLRGVTHIKVPKMNVPKVKYNFPKAGSLTRNTRIRVNKATQTARRHGDAFMRHSGRNAYRTAPRAMRYTVCPNCSGSGRVYGYNSYGYRVAYTCSRCGGRGYVRFR